MFYNAFLYTIFDIVYIDMRDQKWHNYPCKTSSLKGTAVDTRPKKPARNAEVYLSKEDKQIYKNLVIVITALKEYMYPTYLPSNLSKALNSTAGRVYCNAEQKASKFWGSYEIDAVRDKEREDGIGRVGCFCSDSIHSGLKNLKL